MSSAAKCTRCGHSELIPQARVVCKTESGDVDIKIRVDGNPRALLLKHAAHATLRATVCAKCGYTEFYADDPRSLFNAWTESQKGPA